MDVRFDNKLISSFLLAVDHEILENGAAYTNYSGSLYRVLSSIGGYNIYTTPYRQLVNDVSITGALIMSGVYISGVFVQPGQSGLNSINITEGQAYLSGTQTSISGYYAVKDYNTYLTFDPEEQLLFEDKLFIRPKIPQTITGLSQNTQTCPAVYIKPMRGENIPFCLGGGQNKSFDVRAIVLGDSEFSMNAVCDILKGMAHKYYQIIDHSALPFNSWGAYTGVDYNYHTLITGHSIGQTYVNKASVSYLMGAGRFNEVNPRIFPAFVDFELWTLCG